MCGNASQGGSNKKRERSWVIGQAEEQLPNGRHKIEPAPIYGASKLLQTCGAAILRSTEYIAWWAGVHSDRSHSREDTSWVTDCRVGTCWAWQAPRAASRSPEDFAGPGRKARACA